jgi:hypothetical protein
MYATSRLQNIFTGLERREFPCDRAVFGSALAGKGCPKQATDLAGFEGL